MKKVAIITVASGGLGKQFVEIVMKESVDQVWCIPYMHGLRHLLILCQIHVCIS